MNDLCFICNDEIVDKNLKVKELINKNDKMIKILVYNKSTINNVNNQLMALQSIKKEIQLNEYVKFNLSALIEDKISKYNEAHQKKFWAITDLYI